MAKTSKKKVATKKKRVSRKVAATEKKDFIIHFEINETMYKSEGATLEAALVGLVIPNQMIKTKGVITMEHKGTETSQILQGFQVRQFMRSPLFRKIYGKKLFILMR